MDSSYADKSFNSLLTNSTSMSECLVSYLDLYDNDLGDNILIIPGNEHENTIFFSLKIIKHSHIMIYLTL